MVDAVRALAAPTAYHGRILDSNGIGVGTCFQIDCGVLVTAFHVIEQAGGGQGGTVRFEPLDGHATAGAAVAQVVSVDQVQDLAVLETDQPLPASASLLAYSDAQQPGTKFHLTGFATLPEPHGDAFYRYLSATGSWEGKSAQLNGPAVARGRADGLEPGMSGCPVLRTGDNAVIGVVTGRYNSINGWSAGRIWISRTESLEHLLPSRAKIAFEPHHPLVAWNRSAQLNEVALDRGQRRDDERFILPGEWQKAWEHGLAAITHGDVLVIAALPGVGATTFAEHLLARHAPERMQLACFEPGDWDEPLASALRPRPWHAYVLDLRDPEHDRPSDAFVESLGKLADSYRSMQSRLVITVREHLWRGRDAKPIPNVRTVRLNTAPDSRALVERYIDDQAPDLLSIVRLGGLAEHLDGMNAVQAMETVETILLEGDSARQDGISEPEQLRQRLTDVLDDHHDELDRLFGQADLGTPAHESRDIRRPLIQAPLSVQDRCLLLALACRKSTLLSELEQDSEQLRAKLQDGRPTYTQGDAEPYLALAGPGLRGRLSRIGARASQGDNVFLDRPRFGDAVVRYVWDNYTAVRRPLASWLIDLATEGAVGHEAAAGWLSELVRRKQDVDFIRGELVDLVRSTRDRDRTALLVEVVHDAVQDPHMQRRCERLLYDWAIRPELQMVVVEVSRRLLSTPRRVIALRRLQRVADSSKTPPEAQRAVQEVFRSAVDDPSLCTPFLDTVRTWFRDAASTTAAKLALTAAIHADVAGTPWLLTDDARDIDITALFGEALADPDMHDALTTLIQKSSSSDEMYTRALYYLTQAATAHGAVLAFLSFTNRLRDAGLTAGRNPVDDLNAELKLIRTLPRSVGNPPSS